MRIPDSMLAGVVRGSSPSVTPPEGDPMEAKLELARWIVRRSHGEEAAAAAEAHFTRVVREGGAPEEVAGGGAARGDPVHLPALLVGALGVGSTSEARRLIAQGGGEGRRRAGARAGRARARALDGAVVQAGKRRFARLRRCVDTPLRSACYHSRAARQGGVGKSLHLDTWSALGRPTRIRSKSAAFWRPLARVGGFFTPSARQRRSLKTQQRAFTSRPRSARLRRAGRGIKHLVLSFGTDL